MDWGPLQPGVNDIWGEYALLIFFAAGLGALTNSRRSFWWIWVSVSAFYIWASVVEGSAPPRIVGGVVTLLLFVAGGRAFGTFGRALRRPLPKA